MKRLLPWLLLLLMPVCALGEWYSFTSEEVPYGLRASAMLVTEGTREVRVSFLGDCTLGSEKRYLSSERGFAKTALRQGYDWFFGGLSDYLTGDDITLVNLEGVLSDADLPPVEKEFNFQGKSDYARILKQGSVECVTVANNHSLDYGEQGFADTLAALDAAGIAYTGSDCLAVWDSDGIRIGFTASLFRLSDENKEQLRQNVKLLRDIGCGVIIHSMHCGEEYAQSPNAAQRDTAQFVAGLGVDMIVGHHPHIVQGMERLGDTWVLYSLGNAVFGGNSAPRDMDALLAQAVFRFDCGELTGSDMKLYPISVSSSTKYNDYRPVLLEESGAERVFRKMKTSTGVDASQYGGNTAKK